MTRLRVLIPALLSLLSCVAMAQAPAALEASSPSACMPSAEPTRDTACGACGTGWRSGTGAQLHAEATPGLRVAADGYWWTCTMPEPPKPPPPPADCGVTDSAAVVTWQVGPNRCAGGRAAGISHGKDHLYRQVFGPMRGELAQLCTNGALSTRWASCAPAQVCDTSWSHTKGGATYTYNARAEPVQLGAYVRALAADGSGLRLRCVAGDLVPAVQCEGPQSVSRSFGTERRFYRYAGLPVDVGAQVRAEQTHVISRAGVQSAGANRIRWTNATCTPGGVLQ